MIESMLNKNVRVRLKYRRFKGKWEEVVGELVYIYKSHQYFIKDYIVYICNIGEDGNVIKEQSDSGVLMMLQRQDIGPLSTKEPIDFNR